jgi:hypothetical protein
MIFPTCGLPPVFGDRGHACPGPLGELEGRFLTSDAPVQIPFVRNLRPSLNDANTVWWPIGPRRAVAWSHVLVGEKVVFRKATTSMTDTVRAIMLQGRDRFVIATERQLGALPIGKRIA